MITFLHFPCQPFLTHQSEKIINIKIAALGQASEQPLKVELWDYPNNEPAVTEMQQDLQTETFTIYSADIQNDPSCNLQSYVFRLHLPGNELKWLSSLKLSINEPLASERYNVNLNISSASWMQDQIFYQIFPDRFASSKVDDMDFALQYEPTPENLTKCRYQGDLKAIKNKISYLKKLGFTGIYLNPVLSSPSIHGFDVTDFSKVNPNLGTNDDLIELIKEVHEKQMKVILDLPAASVSSEYPMYDKKDETGCGACCHRDSPFRGCFTFNDGQAAACCFDSSQVKLNYASQKVQDMMYRDENSAIKKYLSAPYEADGLRLVGSHIIGSKGTSFDNHRYLKKIMRSAKDANPNCYIMGDHSYDARPWICLNENQEDGALNIQGFYKPMIQFLSGKDYYSQEDINYQGDDFKACIDRYHCGIPHDMLISMFNIIGNHDTHRIATLLRSNPQKIRLALTMMFTWVGIPCVYYGDEIGLTGGPYHEARLPMDWTSDKDVFKNLLLVLSKFRKNCECLRVGALRVTYGSGNMIIYERTYGWHKTIVIINRSNSITTADVNENLRDLNIQMKVMCNIMEKGPSCHIKPENDIRNTIIMDNIRIMPYSELDKSGVIKIGPTSALIIT